MFGWSRPRDPHAPRPQRPPTGMTLRRRALRRGQRQRAAAAPPGMGRFGLPAPVEFGDSEPNITLSR